MPAVDELTARVTHREPDLRFAVRGIPGPQGSKDFKGFSRAGRAILVESSKLVKPWRQDVVVAAVTAMEDQGPWHALTGAVHVIVEFYLPRPKSQPKTRRTLPKTTPDLDKLIRATHDALKTAGVYRDDALVTDITTRKRYVVQDPALGHPWELPGAGAVISVYSVTEEDTWADQPLELSVAQRFPIAQLPGEIADQAGYTPVFDHADALGQVLTTVATDTDSRALQTLRKAVNLMEKRLAMPTEKAAAQVPVTVVIEEGLGRLSSVSGQPVSALQEAVIALAARGTEVGVSVLLTDHVVATAS
jgi:Holliday junction resolvase RusA-like endonuclease